MDELVTMTPIAKGEIVKGVRCRHCGGPMMVTETAAKSDLHAAIVECVRCGWSWWLAPEARAAEDRGETGGGP